jgi:hypothetical protein
MKHSPQDKIRRLGGDGSGRSTVRRVAAAAG